jgi:hypothetical protein
MKRMLVLCGAAVIAVGLAGCGQGHGNRGAFRAACGADIQTLCAGVDRSGIRQCMTDHAGQLSAGCKAFLAQRQAAMGSSAAPAPSGAPAASAAPASGAQ